MSEASLLCIDALAPVPHLSEFKQSTSTHMIHNIWCKVSIKSLTFMDVQCFPALFSPLCVWKPPASLMKTVPALVPPACSFSYSLTQPTWGNLATIMRNANGWHREYSSTHTHMHTHAHTRAHACTHTHTELWCLLSCFVCAAINSYVRPMRNVTEAILWLSCVKHLMWQTH